MVLSRHSRDPRDYRPPALRRQRDFERVEDKKKGKVSRQRDPPLSPLPSCPPTARLNKKYGEKHRARLGGGCFMDRGNFNPRCEPRWCRGGCVTGRSCTPFLPSLRRIFVTRTTRKAPRDLYTSVSHLVAAESGISLSMGRSNFLLKVSPSKRASRRAFFPSRWEALRLMNEFNGRTIHAGEVNRLDLINILSKSVERETPCLFLIFTN